MRDFGRIRESEGVRKREEEVFVEKKKKKELWRMWRDEGDEENEEEKETVGNYWEKWKDKNTPDS